MSQSSIQGVTLVEMVVVIVILAIALSTVTQLLSQTTVSGAYTYDETMAVELGQSYIAEITSKRYDENSPIGGVPPCGAPVPQCVRRHWGWMKASLEPRMMMSTTIMG